MIIKSVAAVSSQRHDLGRVPRAPLGGPLNEDENEAPAVKGFERHDYRLGLVDLEDLS